MSRSFDGNFAPLLRPKMPELDTLRGLAILSVVLLHGFYWEFSSLHFGSLGSWVMRVTSAGWIGVNLFFVLSGFLITGILLRSRDDRNYFGRFYARRALRILPAYYGLLLILVLIQRGNWGFLLFAFFYMANVAIVFGIPTSYGPLWSLAVEEHYYLCWPLIVRRLSATSVRNVSLLIFALVPAVRFASFHFGHTIGIAWYTWCTADGLALGSMLAAVVYRGCSRRQLRNLAATLFGIVTTAVVVGTPFGILTRNRALGAAFQYTLAHCFFAALLLVFLLLGTSQYCDVVRNRVLEFFGYLSYGLYLVHLLIFRTYDAICRRFASSLLPTHGRFELVLVRFALAGSTAVVIAYLSRRYYEERFLKLKDSLANSAQTRLD